MLLYGVWQRYGVPGLGAGIAAVHGPSDGHGRRSYARCAEETSQGLDVVAGVVLWTSILVVAGIVGLGLIHAIH